MIIVFDVTNMVRFLVMVEDFGRIEICVAYRYLCNVMSVKTPKIGVTLLK